MSQLSCPHCQALYQPDARFCESCGQALPASTGGGPRVVEAGGFAASDVGRNLQSEELRKKAKTASGALLAVAILQTLGALVLPALLSSTGEAAREEVVVMAVILGVIAAIFYGLWLWARQSPYPAAIVGLVLLVSLWLLDALIDPTALVRGIIIKIIILVVLIRAVKAGAEHRALKKQMAAA